MPAPTPPPAAWFHGIRTCERSGRRMVVAGTGCGRTPPLPRGCDRSGEHATAVPAPTTAAGTDALIGTITEARPAPTHRDRTLQHATAVDATLAHCSRRSPNYRARNDTREPTQQHTTAADSDPTH